ncbi:MAG: BON domain-containing protein [Planctomycetia bacterium]
MADTPASPEHPLAARLKAAIKAHPVLRDEKKLQVKVVHGVVRLEGTVFTRDTLRQLLEMMGRLPGGNDVAVVVEPEVAPPDPTRRLEGKVPTPSQGGGGTKVNYSVGSSKPRA